MFWGTLCNISINNGGYVNISKNKSIILLVGLFIGLSYSVESNSMSLITFGSDLQSAVQKEDVSKVNELLSKKRFLLWYPFLDLDNLLFDAIDIGNVKIAKLLLQKAGVSVHAWKEYLFLEQSCKINSVRLQPLHVTARKGDTEMTRLLLEYKANFKSESLRPYFDTRRKYKFGKTPLHYAAKQGHTDVVRLLIKAGAEIDAKRGSFLGFGRWPQETPLHLAVKGGHIQTAKCLLDSGAQVDLPIAIHLGSRYATCIPDTTYESAIHLAARNGDFKMIELLLSYGADPNATVTIVDKQRSMVTRYTPLFLAQQSKKPEAVKLLVEKDAIQKGSIKIHPIQHSSTCPRRSSTYKIYTETPDCFAITAAAA